MPHPPRVLQKACTLASRHWLMMGSAHRFCVSTRNLKPPQFGLLLGVAVVVVVFVFVIAVVVVAIVVVVVVVVVGVAVVVVVVVVVEIYFEKKKNTCGKRNALKIT